MQDLESAMLQSLEGTFTTYVGNESIYAYNQRDPLQNHYAGVRAAARRAAIMASRKAAIASMAEIPKFDTVDAILSLKPLTSDDQLKAGLTKMASLFRTTAAVTGVGASDMKGTSRLPHICRARQIFYWLCRHYTSCSFPQIGSYLGKDHSTVVHGVQKVSRSLALYPEINKIKAMLGAVE